MLCGSCAVRLCAAESRRMRVAVPNTCPSLRGVLGLVLITGPFRRFGGRLDASFGVFLLAGDALGVNAQQDAGAVPGPFGDLGCWDSGVKPGRYSGVTQVVGRRASTDADSAGAE